MEETIVDYNLKKMAEDIRKRCIELAHVSGNNAAHLGPGLSLVEIFTALYGKVMNFNKEVIQNPERDRLILSKEHGVLSYYAALEYINILNPVDLNNFMRSHSAFLGHPVMNRDKGIEFTSGSLGMGLSLAIGVAISLKRKNSDAKVYVIIGDGECNEGSIWEGIMYAGMHKLDNLVVIIDHNGYQLGGKTEETLDLGNFCEKFNVFNWKSVQCNGHDIEELISALTLTPHEQQPLAIIANTTKGKGISFAENSIEWHHAVVTDKLYTQAMQELGEKHD